MLQNYPVIKPSRTASLFRQDQHPVQDLWPNGLVNLFEYHTVVCYHSSQWKYCSIFEMQEL